MPSVARLGEPRPHLDSAPTPRVAASRRTPPGPEGSKGRRALSGARGAFACLASLSGGRCRCWWLGFRTWTHPSRSTAATGPRRSPRSSGRTTSPSRCATRWRTTGSTTPTSSPARAAAARRPRPASWPAASTARRRRSPTRAASATPAATWPRGGRGSIDVIEIDAASHGGVDDARDLREKAFFAPVRDRYKIYIIDEAHMVTTQGFNALLKLVEEPPPHLRFIFATTEPEKVIPTIRSRTHHYPFRLIPPRHALRLPRPSSAQREGVAHRAGRAAAGRTRRRRVGPRHALGARPADRRRRARRRHPRAGQPRCSASPPTPCSTRSSTPSPPPTAPRCSASSTR